MNRVLRTSDPASEPCTSKPCTSKPGASRSCAPGRSSLLVCVVAALLLSACGGDDTESNTGGSETTTGSENTGDGAASGIQAPPGSTHPDDGSWDGDQANAGTPAADAGTPTADGAAAAGDAAPAASPWGQTRAQQCQAPARHALSGSAQSSFQQGVRAAAQGNATAATRAFQSAISADSRAYPAAYNLGVMADRAGNANDALDWYRRSLTMQADYERAAEGIITIYLRRGSVPDALAFIEPLARRNATNLALQALYADVLVRAERYDDAWEAARTALRCDERYVPALKALVKASLRQGRTEMATSILDQALSIDDNDAELHFIKGTMLRADPGRLRDTMTQFERAIQLRPDYTEARMALGVQLLAGVRYTEALTHFEAAAALAPTLVPVHLNLADAYRATKQWEKAKAEFDRVLRMDGNNAQAHFDMGLMYLSAGADYPGLELLTSLQKAKQEFTAYRNQMGPRLPRNDPSEAYLADLDRQIERTQRNIERDAARAQRDAERAARAAALDGGT